MQPRGALLRGAIVQRRVTGVRVSPGGTRWVQPDTTVPKNAQPLNAPNDGDFW